MLKKKANYTVAVVGATSAAGRETVEILEERNFPLTEAPVLLAPEHSAGERIEFKGRSLPVRTIAEGAFPHVDIAFFSSGSEETQEFVRTAAGTGAVVIDASSAARRDPTVPLIVPEINAVAATGHKGIIANPNSSAIGLAMAVKSIRDRAGIKRIVVTTFQSVSGTGKEAMDELAQQTVALLNFREVETKVYHHQIAFNCLPQVDNFLETGYTREELEISAETKKILADDALEITATAVRVPVFRCHSQSVNIETEKPISANETRALLSAFPGVTVYDDPGKQLYPTAIDIVGRDEVYVGRIREDRSVPNGIDLWLVFDNLRKGDALNAVQIAESLIE